LRSPLKGRSDDEAKLGAFLGVYTPTVLTILGVIMYLRLGWVTGQVGLAKTLLIVVIANLITLVTTLSFSAIATNFRVGVGGAYFIISRSLGLEFGGAIGLPLFLSQAFSVSLYAFGLAESLRLLWPGVPLQFVAVLIVLAVAVLALRGAQLALKAQLPIMALIVLSLVALLVGALSGPKVQAEVAQPAVALGFWAVFAVFFPAVTGIMAGLGLSGDLRDPIKAIPRGALAATITGFVVYLLIPMVLTRGATSEALRENPMIWTKIAPLGVLLIMPGLWGAIFSSAVGSILGAPRTLQALAADGLAPKVLRRRREEKGEPVKGLLVALVLALLGVTLGDLNAVAPVVTMFFLTVYGMVNIVAALETISGDPSWRPALHVPWWLCLAAGVGCFWVMFLINPTAAMIAIVIEFVLWSALARREKRAGWGDVRRGVYEALIRWSLIRLSHRPMTPRNWRPHVLVFVEDPERRLDLILFGTWFSQGRGVVTVCELVVGDLLGEDLSIDEREEDIRRTLRREGLVAFGEVDVVHDVVAGITNVAQANGIAGLDSNTILIGWPRNPARAVEFLKVVHRMEHLHKSVVIGRIPSRTVAKEYRERVIHVWWGGLQRNSDLMLLLAHLITLNPQWRNARIKILSVASNELMKTNTEAYLAELIPAIRISAEAEVMLRQKDRKIRDIIHEESAEADIVFLGLDPPQEEEEMEAYVERLNELSESLRTVFFVKNASLFVGQLVQTTEEVAAATEEQSEEESPPTDPPCAS